MESRPLSIVRRRNNLVDLVTDNLQTEPIPTYGYRYEAAQNFDAVFAVMQDMNNGGFISATAVDNALNDSRFKGKVRFLFNPDDYVPVLPWITDITPFFIRLLTQPYGGAFGPPSMMTVIMPYDSSSDPPLILNGDAPNAATIAGSIGINLPRNCANMVIKNVDAMNLIVAFSPGGPEYTIYPGERVEFEEATISQLFVRGDGAITTFNAVCIIQNSSIR